MGRQQYLVKVCDHAISARSDAQLSASEHKEICIGPRSRQPKTEFSARGSIEGSQVSAVSVPVYGMTFAPNLLPLNIPNDQERTLLRNTALRRPITRALANLRRRPGYRRLVVLLRESTASLGTD